MMIVIGIILLIVILALGVGAAASRGPPAAPVEPPAEPTDDALSPSELAAKDQLAALIRYGTPEDAARLGELGVDPGKLGYRPPNE